MKQGIISLALTSALWVPLANAQSPTQKAEGDDLVTVEGNLLRDDGGLKIQLSDNRVYEIKSAKRQCQEDLDHLESGDHLIGLGHVQSLKKMIWLEDVEMVGVRKVLGAWEESAKRKRFDFRDFTSLNVSDLARVRGQSLNYRLVPDKKDEWTIFLSTDTSVKVGNMKYNPSNLRIEVIDLKSGRVGETFNLSAPTKK